MKRYFVLICFALELCVNPCFAQSGSTSSRPTETIVQSFTLLRAGSSVKVAWQTSRENRNNYFEIQRSTNGTQFSVVALVFAREHAEQGADYIYVDHPEAQPATEFIYYRIRQVSMDGTSEPTETRRFRVAENKALPRQ